MDVSNKKAYFILCSILLLTLAINLVTFKNGHDWDVDTFMYLDQARTLIIGNFEELFSVHKYRLDHSTNNSGTFLYHWGLPMLLSPIYYAFGLDIHAIYIMKVFINLFFILSLIVVFFLFKDSLSNAENILLVSAIAFSKWFFDFKDYVIADLPFFFISMLTLFFIKKVIIKKEIIINRAFSCFIIGLLLFVAFFLKPAGIILLPTLLIVQYIEGRRSSKTLKGILLKDKFVYFPFIVFTIFVVASKLIIPSISSSDYAAVEFSRWNVKWILVNIKYYSVLFSRFFPFLFLKMSAVFFVYNKYSLIFYGMMIVLIIFGLVRNTKKDYMYVTYALFSLALYIVYPMRQGARYIIPLFPFFLYFLFLGLKQIRIYFDFSEKYKPQTINCAMLFGIGLMALSLVYIASSAYSNIVFNRANISDGPYTDDSIELFSYIKKNTVENDTFIFHKPQAISLYADRKALSLTARNFSLDHLLNTPARYIAYDKKNSYLSIEVRDLKEQFECMFENDTYILCDIRNGDRN